MEHVTSRVGILDRSGYRIRSVRRVQGVASVEEMGSDGDDIRIWFVNQSEEIGEDNSYIAFFYRCLEEGSEFYYLYEEGVGWRCGGTSWDTPILGRLVPYAEARAAVEEWGEDLKWSLSKGE